MGLTWIDLLGWCLVLAAVCGCRDGITVLTKISYSFRGIMDYRNLNRVFTFNKGLRSWVKSSGYDLSGKEVLILLSIHHLAGLRGVGLYPLRAYLCSFYRSVSPDGLLSVVKKLEGLGLVSISGRYPALYSLTLSGRIALNDLELRCRNTRYDK